MQCLHYMQLTSEAASLMLIGNEHQRIVAQQND